MSDINIRFIRNVKGKLYRWWKDLLRDFQQQTLPRSSFLYDVYGPLYSSVLCLVIGFIFIFLGIVYSVVMASSKDYTIAYNSKLGSPFVLEFDTDEAMASPVYVFYELRNFYANTRNYVRDAPSYVYSDNSCAAMTKKEQGFDLRLVNDVITLPELYEDILTTELDDNGSNTLYPCGLASVSIFNDEFDISEDLAGDKVYSLDKNIPGSKFDMLIFLNKNSTYADVHPWYLTHMPAYRVWLQPPFLPSFRRYYGRIDEEVPAGKHYLLLKSNLWPAEAWGASKFVTLSTITTFGTRNTPFLVTQYVIGVISLLCGCYFIVIGRYCKRRLGPAFKYMTVKELFFEIETL